MGYFGRVVVQALPAGANRQVQFNNNGVLDGNPKLIFRKSTGNFEVGGALRATAQLTTLQKTQPADADLDNGELAIWYDEPNGRVRFKAKTAAGVIVRANLALA